MTSRRTVCVREAWQVCLDTAALVDNQAGVDNAWEQYKLEARKMLENGDDWAREQSTTTTVRPA
jgi:hypothetical protein